MHEEEVETHASLRALIDAIGGRHAVDAGLWAMQEVLVRQGVWSLSVPEVLGGGGAAIETAVVAVEAVSFWRASLGAWLASALTCGFVSDWAAQPRDLGRVADGGTGTLVGLERVPGPFRRAGSAARPTVSGRTPVAYSAGPPEHLLVVADGSAGRDVALYAVAATGPGVSAGPRTVRTGLHGYDAWAVGMDDAAGEAVLRGREAVAWVQGIALVLLGAVGRGIVRRALGSTGAHVQAREQFGKPLAAQPLVTQALERMQDEASTLGTAVDGAATRLGQSVAGSGAEPSRLGLSAFDRVVGLCGDAVQLHGGYGYIREQGAEQLLRDSLSLRANAAAFGAGGPA